LQRKHQEKDAAPFPKRGGKNTFSRSPKRDGRKKTAVNHEKLGCHKRKRDA